MEWLNLESTSISDAGVAGLAGLSKLQTLNLSGTRVTDTCLETLSGLKSLKELNLSFTSVSEDGVTSFLVKVPGCEVKR